MKKNQDRQVIMTETAKILVGTRTDKSGNVRNRYEVNANSKPLVTVKNNGRYKLNDVKVKAVLHR